MILLYSFFFLWVVRHIYHPINVLYPQSQQSVGFRETETQSFAETDQEIIYQTPILLYHYVEYLKDPHDTLRRSLDVTPDVFEKQLTTLLAAGYHFITMAELGEALGNKFVMPIKPIVLTFDDGYKDFYTDVYPLILKYKIKATVYVISHVLGKPNYLTAANVQEIARSGLVEIAAHTRTHIDVRSVDNDTLISQIQGSREDLSRLTGLTIQSFAYPYGYFDEFSKQTVRSAGFLTGVSTSFSKGNGYDRYTINRLRPQDLIGLPLLGHIQSELDKRQNTYSYRSASIGFR